MSKREDLLERLYSEEDFEWLELDKIPDQVYNPFLETPLIDQEDPYEELVKRMVDANYLHVAARLILNIELLPFQLVMLDVLWNHTMPLIIATRGSAKSYGIAVYGLLRMIFHPDCKIVVVGAGLRQSKVVFDYMVDIWNKAPVLQDIAGKDGGPRQAIDRFEFKVGKSKSTFVPLGQGDKIRGLRANYIIAEEFASLPEEIFNTVVQAFAMVASDPIGKVKEAASIKRLKKLGVWNDAMQQLKDTARSDNQIVRIGTAFFAFNHFSRSFEQWSRIIKSKGDPKILKEMFGSEKEAAKIDWTQYAVLRIPYNYLPEGFLDEGIISQAKATLNTGQFHMELGAIFISDTNGFFRRSILEAATTNKPIKVAENEEVQFSVMKYGDINKSYIIGVDPAADQDNAAIVVLEDGLTHRKIVQCWTTNKKKYNNYREYMRSLGVEVGEDYYYYIAKRIRKIMREFNVSKIAMDKNGGGTAIAEALGSKNSCEKDELPIFEEIIPDEEKFTDGQTGIHILRLMKPTSDLNASAAHGLLKDFQDKKLLFPMFDAIEIAKSVEMDKLEGSTFDTYEDLVEQIEELKNELTTIVCTPSSTLGKETFDTPEIKQAGSKKGRLRKDRYSALLYANYFCRNRESEEPLTIKYKALGGLKSELRSTPSNGGAMYHGIGMAAFDKNVLKGYTGGMVVRRGQ